MIRLLICEDVSVLRAGLVALLSRPADFWVVTQLENSDELLPVATITQPDITLIDLDMPGSAPALTSLRETIPACRTLALYHPGNPGHITRYATAPVDAVLPKNASPNDLLSTVRHLAADHSDTHQTRHHTTPRTTPNPLTPREATVLRIASEGLSATEIANHLNLAPSTVRNYIARAITKTGTRNRLDAIRHADQHGWLLPTSRQQ